MNGGEFVLEQALTAAMAGVGMLAAGFRWYRRTSQTLDAIDRQVNHAGPDEATLREQVASHSTRLRGLESGQSEILEKLGDLDDHLSSQDLLSQTPLGDGNEVSNEASNAGITGPESGSVTEEGMG